MCGDDRRPSRAHFERSFSLHVELDVRFSDLLRADPGLFPPSFSIRIPHRAHRLAGILPWRISLRPSHLWTGGRAADARTARRRFGRVFVVVRGQSLCFLPLRLPAADQKPNLNYLPSDHPAREIQHRGIPQLVVKGKVRRPSSPRYRSSSLLRRPYLLHRAYRRDFRRLRRWSCIYGGRRARTQGCRRARAGRKDCDPFPP